MKPTAQTTRRAVLRRILRKLCEAQAYDEGCSPPSDYPEIREEYAPLHRFVRLEIRRTMPIRTPKHA